jgi:Arc/MetJ-type ribon-helix-helix transcriptional regulator
MSYPFPADLQQLIAEQMATGKYASEDVLLRNAVRALAEDEDDLEAIRVALAEIRAGDPGTPLVEAFEAVLQSVQQEIR